jgi:hypothetical protein
VCGNKKESFPIKKMGSKEFQILLFETEKYERCILEVKENSQSTSEIEKLFEIPTKWHMVIEK